MLTTPDTVAMPLREDDGGVIRVGGTRVTLQAVIADFREGASPEQIVAHYPALDLSQVYLVIGYYLQHRDEVEAYVREQRARAEQARRGVETRSMDDAWRAKVLAARDAVDKAAE